MRLKRTRTISKRTAQKAAVKARTSVRNIGAAVSEPSQLVRQNAVLLTKHATAKAGQAAANVADAAEDAIETAGLLDWQLARNLLDAVAYSVDMWKLQAHFRDIRIMALSAIGTPGCLDGPELDHYIAQAPQTLSFSGNKAELRDAVAEGVSDCFAQWQFGVTVPGLPWYPAFVAFPAPAAPPMPNVPTPLIACVSSAVGKILTPAELSGSMSDALPDALRTDEVESGLENIAQALALAFSMWLPSAQVLQVMGKGPIPTYAPPYVPTGPVLNGDTIETPGHLATAPRLNIILPPQLFQ